MTKGDPEICEVHIAGQGGGYGECILIHLGNNAWIIIDSCVDPENREPIPLRLLDQFGVDPKNVVLILCTHWHKDHINGLSNVLDKCRKATFCFAHPSDKEKFLNFIEFDYQHKARFGNSAADEFHKCLSVLNKSENRKRILRASADKVLYSIIFNGIKIKASSLSPSDKAVSDFEVELSGLLNDKTESNIRIPLKSPNDKSVVLLLEVGSKTILLGADLEVINDDDYGWLNITRYSRLIPGVKKSSLYKIPHHGSKNGYHEEIWNVLLETKPNSLITPYSKSSLPKEEFVKLYSNLSKGLHFTSPPKKSTRPKKRDRSVNKLIKDLNPTIKEIRSSYGVVSCYIDFTDDNSTWSFNYDGEAFEYN